MLNDLRIDNIDAIEDENWRPCRNLACAVLVRALKDAAQDDWTSETFHSQRSDKCTPADKASAQFFLYNDPESLSFWVSLAGLKTGAFKGFLKGKKLDTADIRERLKLGTYDKMFRVRKGYKKQPETNMLQDEDLS
tara:strand:+ start:10 stop:417 length:408 start_codon:yes stop_codon:yes gene_type:complete